MKTSKFDRVEQPKPVEPEWKMCAAPGCAFRAECLVPVGERAVQMCWLCAHHVSEHDCSVEHAATGECECMPHEIYPNRPHPSVLNGTYVERPQYVGRHSERFESKQEAIRAVNTDMANGAIRFPHGDSMRMKHPDDWKTGHFYNQRTGHMETHVRGEVIAEFTLAGELVDSAPVAPVREERTRRKSS